MIRLYAQRVKGASRYQIVPVFTACREQRTERCKDERIATSENKVQSSMSGRADESSLSTSANLKSNTQRASSITYPRVHVTLQERGAEFQESGGSDAGGAVSTGEQLETRMVAHSEVRAFLEAKKHETALFHQQCNADIPYPPHPDDMVPEFRRIKRHQGMVVVATDPDHPTFVRYDNFPAPPPAQQHPWVKNTPIGPHIVHGDGQIAVVGTGEIGFGGASVCGSGCEVGGSTAAPGTEEGAENVLPLPRTFRGLQHRSVIQKQLPQMNGRVLQDAVIKNSFTLTGRGVFATRDVAAGETIMVVSSTARNVGVKGEVERLVEMCTDILLETYNSLRAGDQASSEALGCASGAGEVEKLNYLHEWILTGQPSSLLLHWPARATELVLERIGGFKVLRALELHKVHIARLAAIIDMNSFLVESSYAVRKGMAYFPEAGFLNHSCVPNATYDVIPAHIFRETDYYIDEQENAKGTGASCNPKVASLITEVDVGSSGSHVANSKKVKAGDFCLEDNSAGCDALAPNEPAEYLFCCRATTDIPAGSEILISYVPTNWSFDNRQYVLHDRYRFWCKCPKCAPTLDAQYARVPRLLAGLLVFSIFLQLLAKHQREKVQQQMKKQLEEEEGEEDDKAGQRLAARQRSRGFFEVIEENRQRELYMPDRGPVPAIVADDPWARPPR
ncbi:SET domain [Trypanosoma vivax]|uniref:SET domain-containing protein n=1 Tax=Trypanosoma vivax (strain Y486) TaxID=1055687 RepID=G0U621_TRYVY|nr:hypothetical protein TRVL_06981 [Trypanosoma vivax]KAH8607888.1 SET domain [Trypanosoma vivax]CCC51322.1 conserved hypothetical protein [Trypanosoma vivax Y486]